jgi:general secretion pathway protein K
MHYKNNQKGIALVVTLLVLVIITAMVVEFSYAVYTGTGNLYNWRDSQRLSLMAKSGVHVSSEFLSEIRSGQQYTYPGSIEMPVENPFEDFTGTITVRIEDENGKFNLNAVIHPDGSLNDDVYAALKRLLRNLSLNEKIADRIADWIDPDSNARLPDSEEGAKNAPLDSVDELLLIHGISRKDYDTLLPYVTVLKKRDNLVININSVEKPVLRALSADITDEYAQRVIDYRNAHPFEDKSQLQKVSGFTSQIYDPISSMITIRGEHFSFRSMATSGGIKRIIEAKLDYSRSPAQIEYWKEY